MPGFNAAHPISIAIPTDPTLMPRFRQCSIRNGYGNQGFIPSIYVHASTWHGLYRECMKMANQRSDPQEAEALENAAYFIEASGWFENELNAA